MHEPLWLLTPFPGFLRNTPAAPARANSNLGGSLGAGRKVGGRGRERRGGGLMSHECRSIVSKTHPSSTSQSGKYDPACPSGGFNCSNIYSHFQLLFLIHAEAILPHMPSLSGVFSLITSADINVSI